MSTNPYEPAEPIEFATSQKMGWIATASVSAVLPLAVAALQRMSDCSNAVWLLALAAAIGVALISLQGTSRVWGFLMSLVVFTKFTILATILDFMFYGFDGVQR